MGTKHSANKTTPASLQKQNHQHLNCYKLIAILS